MALSLLPKQEKITSKASSVNKAPEMQGMYLSSEIRSGFFVLISILTLIALLFVSGQSQFFGQTKKYSLFFNYVGGLTENSPVHLAGHKVGKVTKIEYLGSEPSAIRVDISIGKNTFLRKDSAAYIDAMGFMGEKFVELTSGTREATILEEGATLQGTDPMPVMELVKKGTELLEQFERSGDAMEGIATDLQAVVGDNKEELNGTIQNVHQMSSNLKDMTHDLKLHPWKLLRKSKPASEEGKKKKRFLFF